ncbi:hypothetical protein BT63DRAFT_1703 [Microthyrium microscopicum]|uniref:RING-type E3 ubiquitin transferase n=1 Tax=Microthyrium microscopicum TaxID=703497 RepID=A0A6A6UQQ4_9PEZI|nr:hypothetical protein BT63DRAFT_1703 [Microthyrium microscopicum]
MRPSRIFLLILCCLATVLVLLLVPRNSNPYSAKHGAQRRSGIRALVSFNTPLFPLSAIIALTDDNSTFFLSRPAAFGPLLPAKGLSGQLWIGSGFGEDPRGWVGAEKVPEGELGCSDVPGWDESLSKLGGKPIEGSTKKKLAVAAQSETTTKSKATQAKRSSKEKNEIDDVEEEEEQVPKKKIAQDDGTDDHLYQALADIDGTAEDESGADIQSLQESAAIRGKVVLLSRGGCGFYEKVKWAQRRGATALIVGDNIPGGPLITMYAKGDTSNITIPALFTSHTTAHLLSSLIPPYGFSANPSIGNGASEDGTSKDANDKFATKSTKNPKPKQANGKSSAKNIDNDSSTTSRGFFGTIFSLFGLFGRSSSSNGNTRPPNSGDHEWVQLSEWEDVSRKSGSNNGGNKSPDFVIGVQDWRDPGLSKTSNSKSKALSDPKSPKDKRFAGGSITPSSGEYRRDGTFPADKSTGAKVTKNTKSEKVKAEKSSKDSAEIQSNGNQKAKAAAEKAEDTKISETKTHADQPPHEGLWVTLTPTNMSSSPFFDTILVLVISPLITLTVVYTVLLIRSRIRRRRWRAPKSIVDRLPVRTYQTIPSSGASSTALATPIIPSPTTPLLQHSSTSLRPVISRSHSRNRRPRSRTESEVAGPSSSQHSEEEDDAISMTESEKREKGLAAWRKRYGGRQKECVVCLEEYIDGISRVMSLPCGHEFHVECITPWLTTRRRTCPICKGDVVRSMARHEPSSSSERQVHFSAGESDDDSDAMQTHVALLRNDSPTTHEPIPTDEDVERADMRPEPEEPGVGEWVADRWRGFWDRYGYDRNANRWRGRRRRLDDVDRDR